MFKTSIKSNLFKAAILTSVLTVTAAAYASEFGDVYSAYQTAVTEKNKADTERYALQSYELGKVKFGADSINTGNLALNAGNALIANMSKQTFEKEVKQKAKVLQPQAFELYQETLKIYSEHYGDNGIELIDPLLGLSDASSKKYAREYLDEALDIAEDSDNAMVIADTKMAYFERLVNSRYYTRKVRNYAFDAHEAYSELLPEDAMKRVLNSFRVANVRFAEKDYDESEVLFLGVITQFQKLDYNHPYELAAHAKLVQIYELDGEREKSTQHCIAIGSMKPWKEDIEPTPLFRKNPDYPTSYARMGKSGSAQLSFTIDEMGFVKDPVVIDTIGGEKFATESLLALKLWRYAPKFVDGKAVEAKEVRVQLEYYIEKR
ncbi:cell envelope biogenesis protein TonB [Shewanella sairae]|uniref:Cell envelope biogenesis protein TonB n=1 Tax=Shewanella sairae TaxID=190310 RepID=A0ABQ4PC39_9GAMM|nr:energy transducer TonB [Shewanella sairae]MCL1129932.1 energy transducer TonB [Shewanella sairae]GIU44998.1 cell envelope biogenesis protein TonB [Shewanella sairae]